MIGAFTTMMRLETAQEATISKPHVELLLPVDDAAEAFSHGSFMTYPYDRSWLRHRPTRGLVRGSLSPP